jgi:KUP system potassium uptake protein
VRFTVEAPASPGVDERLLEELHELCEVRESDTTFILGHSHVKTKPGSSLLEDKGVRSCHTHIDHVKVV